jgi:very-short-patch-repair endonuclease
MTVAEKLEKSKADLLVLTGMNPAINIKKSKTKGLELKSADAAELLFHFINEKTLKIKGLKEIEFESIEEISVGNIAETKSLSEKLKLYYEKGDLNDLNKRAQKTLEETTLFHEEQGVNILFLALGFLKWKEDDKADKEWTSPLVLIPVKIQNEGSKKLQKNENWSVTYNEEDIEPNHSLQESLSKQFGIKLPEMPDWSDYDELEDLQEAWKEWIENTKEVLAIKNGWLVNDDNVLLSFFSFAKYQMYKDLAAEKWCTPENPDGPELMQKLLGDGDGFHGEKYHYGDSILFDKELPADEPFTVMDLDSSQAEVLLEAKHAKCLVVEGPPGTGKSTTITNIIADAINDGKKVLFVAEKMAALDVVKDNLNRVNLGKFCLELHGNKTSKTAFLEDFKTILDNRTDAILPAPFSKEKLNEARNELRKWSDLINIPLAKCGYSPYELFGLLMWSKTQLGADENPSLESLTRNLTEFQAYASKANKATLGYKQAGENNNYIFEIESEEIDKLQKNLLAVGRPELHPFFGTELTYRPSDSELAEIKSAAKSSIEPLERLQELFNRLQVSFTWLSNYSLVDVNKMIQALSIAIQVPDENVFALAGKQWVENETTIKASIAAIIDAKKIKETHDKKLIADVWNADILEARKILAATKNNWFNRIFNRKYRSARKEILGYFINPQQNKAVDLLQISDDIRSFQDLAKSIKQDTVGQQMFGKLWQGLNTDTVLLSKVTDWGLMVQEKVKAGHLNAAIISFLSEQINLENLRQQYEQLTEANNLFNKQFSLLREKLKLNLVISDQWKEQNFEDIKLHISNMDKQIDVLVDWIPFYNKAEELKRNGKNWIVQIAYNWEPAKTKLLHYCLFKVWEQILKTATVENPILDKMERLELDGLRQKFITQDNLLKQHNQVQLIQKHNAAVRSFGSIGQPGFVRDNLRRKRKIPAIRKFLSEAFDAITSVKPVFMMSPLSVATYLEAKTEMFDIVIFDEASQIEPIDAFGAIFRGKQVIVVGDTKQMPPTSFFKKMTFSEDDDDENDDVKDAQSIMELMISRKAKRKYFLWHYRSKHQSLINVSNAKFYYDKLLVYPSKEIERHNIGLKLIKLSCENCPYDGGGLNKGEAKTVAQSILEFARDRPNKTLGVVAFNIKQKEEIQKEVQQLARDNKQLSDFLNKENKDGKKINFIKNLESVQGDERDVIFISIGYGKTQQGQPSYNFGPLNKEGGERRLNVLITRAKEQNIVFSNFSGNELDISRTKNDGVKILCEFLTYAETGNMNIGDVTNDTKADSIFEEEVLAEIARMGYKGVCQVGSKGYRIDIAITHPEKPGKYILAIECDGTAYHSSVSARDRDRLRQQILEAGGWKFYRIWGSNWFRSRAQEIQKLKIAIEEAIANDDQQEAKTNEGLAQITTPLQINTKEEPIVNSDLLFAPYNITLLIGMHSKNIYDLTGEILKRLILKIVHTENPVHAEQIYTRICNFQDAAITQKAKRHIQSHIDILVQSESLIRKGDFIWTTTHKQVIVPRNFGILPNKAIEMIAPEELDEAFKIILGSSFSAIENDLLTTVSKQLGFARKTDVLWSELRVHLNSMIERNIILSLEGMLHLA